MSSKRKSRNNKNKNKNNSLSTSSTLEPSDVIDGIETNDANSHNVPEIGKSENNEILEHTNGKDTTVVGNNESTEKIHQNDFETTNKLEVNGNNGHEVVQPEINNKSHEVAAEELSGTGAEVETSTDDIESKVANESKKNKGKGTKSTKQSSKKTITTPESVPLADPPENFLEDSSDQLQELDLKMTEMKKSLSHTAMPDLMAAAAAPNRVMSPIHQPIPIPYDPFTEALATRESLLTHGLVIPCGWGWCTTEESKTIYNSLLEKISHLEENIPPEARILYLYNHTELHCTVATLSSFKENTTYFASLYQSEEENGDAQRREVMNLWKTALQEYFQTNKNILSTLASDGTFPATIQRVEVCDSAVIFHIDTGEAMEIMRSAVKFASEHQIFRAYEITRGLSPYELTRLVHIPNITHSTFVRFRQTPSNSLRKSLEDIANTWTPLKVQMQGMQIVYENRPYMHLDRSDTIIIDLFPLPLPLPQLEETSTLPRPVVATLKAPPPAATATTTAADPYSIQVGPPPPYESSTAAPFHSQYESAHPNSSTSSIVEVDEPDDHTNNITHIIPPSTTHAFIEIDHPESLSHHQIDDKTTDPIPSSSSTTSAIVEVDVPDEEPSIEVPHVIETEIPHVEPASTTNQEEIISPAVEEPLPIAIQEEIVLPAVEKEISHLPEPTTVIRESKPSDDKQTTMTSTSSTPSSLPVSTPVSTSVPTAAPAPESSSTSSATSTSSSTSATSSAPTTTTTSKPTSVLSTAVPEKSILKKDTSTATSTKSNTNTNTSQPQKVSSNSTPVATSATSSRAVRDPIPSRSFFSTYGIYALGFAAFAAGTAFLFFKRTRK